MKNNFKKNLLSYRSFTIISLATFVFLGTLFFVRNNQDSFLASLTQNTIVNKVNPIREDSELPLLRINEDLSLAAQMKAEDMIEKDYFSHAGPGGEPPWQWLDKVNYNYAMAGENLARDFFDPDILLQAWLDSPAHAKNIYHGYFQDIGIGVASGDLNGRETTVVVMFLGKEVTPALETLAVASPAEDAKEVSGAEAEAEQEPIPELTAEPSPPPQEREHTFTPPKYPPPTDTAVLQKYEDSLLEKENEIKQSEQVGDSKYNIGRAMRKFYVEVQSFVFTFWRHF